jgi:hypothetical protein
MQAIPAYSLSIENSTGPCDPRHESGQKYHRELGQGIGQNSNVEQCKSNAVMPD